LKILTLILAGGTGAELSVLTRHRAKTALPFGGRYRVIDFCLSNCVHSGIQEIAILAQYSPKSLIEHIGMGKPWDLDRRTGGVYILQPTHNGEAAKWYLGTADALYQNIDLIRNSKADTILVLSGDQVYLMDYRKMAEYHAAQGRAATIAFKEVQQSQRSRFGMVRRSRDGLITSFKEKPTSSSYRHASLGIYLFRRDFLLDVLVRDAVDIVFDIIMPLIKRGQVAGYRFDGYWEDIGSIASYYRASLRLLKSRSLITAPDWPVFTKSADLAPAKCFAGAGITNSIVADGCVIRGAVSGSILFPGVSVARGAVVEDSILFPFSRVGTNARVSRSVLDKYVVVGPGARVGSKRRTEARGKRPRRGFDPSIAGIAVLGRRVVVAGETTVRGGTVVEPHTRVGGGAK
jgi:glucose-1-phosphate adenylyltransferase